jgi:thiazole tautomerase (transcriptional regulator TenI)
MIHSRLHPNPSKVSPLPETDRIPVLHAVTSDEIVLRSDFVDRARRVMHAGGPRVAVHVRAPRLGGRRLHELACRVAELQHETGAWLVVNDRADVALTSGARGVQLTSRSMSAEDARVFAPPLWIGASVHSQQDAQVAVDGRARWLVAGHVFETTSHPDAKGRGTAFVAQLAATFSVPIIAIGGVRPEHVLALRSAGAHGVAVIRGVWHASDAGAAVIDYLSAHGAPGGQ